MAPALKPVIIIALSILSGMKSLDSCTMVLVGKEASRTGTVLLAHNNDLTGREASLVQFIPSGVHPPGTTIALKNGCRIPQAARTRALLMVNCFTGFEEGDAVAVNDAGVCIAGGVSLKADRNDRARKLDPLVKTGMSGHIRTIALQRARTARECVQIIGRHYSRYGIAYPSGVGVADREEIWYLEAGGGHFWAAVRVPDTAYLAVANGYRIGRIDFNDPANFITSPRMPDDLVQKGLWSPDEGPFCFRKVFGGKRRESPRKYYDTRRVWRVQSVLSRSLRLPPHQTDPALFLEPDRPVSLSDLKDIMRDRYEGTAFYRCEKERKIGSFSTVHSTVIALPGEAAGKNPPVIWTALSTPLISPYLPFVPGSYPIPPPYRTATEQYDSGSAFWTFRKLALLFQQQEDRLARHRRRLERFEARIRTPRNNPGRRLARLCRKALGLAREALTRE